MSTGFNELINFVPHSKAPKSILKFNLTFPSLFKNSTSFAFLQSQTKGLLSNNIVTFDDSDEILNIISSIKL